MDDPPAEDSSNASNVRGGYAFDAAVYPSSSQSHVTSTTKQTFGSMSTPTGYTSVNSNHTAMKQQLISNSQNVSQNKTHDVSTPRIKQQTHASIKPPTSIPKEKDDEMSSQKMPPFRQSSIFLGQSSQKAVNSSSGMKPNDVLNQTGEEKTNATITKPKGNLISLIRNKGTKKKDEPNSASQEKTSRKINMR